MKWVLFVFLFGGNGPYIGGQPYDTQAECEKERTVLVGAIAENNAKEPVKIDLYTSACAQIRKAPQGKGA